MRKKERHIIILIFAILVIIIAYIIIKQARVELSPGKRFDSNIYTSKDSFMIMDRHMGYINYERFANLTKEILLKRSPTDISIQGDSAYFKTMYPHYFFGQNDDWTRQYKNLPIHITEDGFSAKLQEIDTVLYVLIPYQILSNVVKTEDAD